MSKQAVIHCHSLNKGDFVSAKIYSDIKLCECGGKFSAKENFKQMQLPVCAGCGAEPSKYRIVATFIDDTGVKIRVTVRNDQDGKRLVDSLQVAYWFKTIEREIKENEFDVNKYKSEDSRKAFKFENFSQRYLDHHQKRMIKGEITPSGLRNKQNNCRHLNAFFKNFDISKIRSGKIEAFKSESDLTDSQVNKCLEELRTVLNYAKTLEMINYTPNISVKKTNKRKKTIDLETGLKIISKIENQVVKDICNMLAIYPVRPGEVRALKWKDVDFKNGTLTFCEHFSDNKIIKGRKSQKEGDKYASLTLPMTEAARNIINSQVRDLNQQAHVFKGQRGPYVSNNAFNSAWRKARAAAGFTPSEEMKYDAYELKHAVLSELNERTGGNLKTLEKASGVDIKTLMDRYVYSHDDLNNYFH